MGILWKVFRTKKVTFLPQYIFQDDCHYGFPYGMETINAVNFEDLFDFSPEPVDRLSHDDRELQPTPLTIPPTQAPPNSYVSPSSSVNLKKSPNTANRNTGDVFADFDAITSGLLGGTDVNGSEVKA